jgi:hypothetical protein
MKKDLKTGKLQNYNRPIKKGKAKMGPSTTFSRAVVIVQGRMKFSFFSYFSSISMFLYSSQTANSIRSLYLSTVGYLTKILSQSKKQRQDLKIFLRLTFQVSLLSVYFCKTKYQKPGYVSRG